MTSAKININSVKDKNTKEVFKGISKSFKKLQEIKVVCIK